jgi:hypothetical protein
MRDATVRRGTHLWCIHCAQRLLACQQLELPPPDPATALGCQPPTSTAQELREPPTSTCLCTSCWWLCNWADSTIACAICKCGGGGTWD